MLTNQSESSSNAPTGPAATIEQHNGIWVVRDDLLPGGAKSRFIPSIIKPDVEEVVFGAPFCGGAPVALASEAQRRGLRCTIFYAQRAELHPRQKRVMALGAQLRLVSPGYMTVIQARMRHYLDMRGERCQGFPLGFDVPEAEGPFVAAIKAAVGTLNPGQVWCATGSGMLARCLALAFPRALVNAVAVGLPSRWQHQKFPPNVSILRAREPFERPSRYKAPFPCCPNYDRKAWELCDQHANRDDVALMWNVLGDD